MSGCGICHDPRRAMIEDLRRAGHSQRRVADLVGLGRGLVQSHDAHFDLGAPQGTAPVAAPQAQDLAGGSAVATFERATGFEAVPWQRELLRSEGNVAIVKSRQVGASEAVSMLAVHSMLVTPGFEVLVISPTMKQSMELARKARLGLRRLMDGSGLGLDQRSASTVALSSGSRLVSLPGTATSLRGYRADLLIVDEASWVPVETYEAAVATTARGGRQVVQSTPAWPEGWFWETVEGDMPGWERLRVPATDVPELISPEFLAAQRASLSAAAYGREFECLFTAEVDLKGIQLFEESELLATGGDVRAIGGRS